MARIVRLGAVERAVEVGHVDTTPGIGELLAPLGDVPCDIDSVVEIGFDLEKTNPQRSVVGVGEGLAES